MDANRNRQVTFQVARQKEPSRLLKLPRRRFRYFEFHGVSSELSGYDALFLSLLATYRIKQRKFRAVNPDLETREKLRRSLNNVPMSLKDT